MRISQHALDAIHALEQQVFKKTLSPSERIVALDVVQTAIDRADVQNDSSYKHCDWPLCPFPATEDVSRFDDPPLQYHYCYKHAEAVRNP